MENKFKKIECTHCEKKTWHFKSSDKSGYECPCRSPQVELKNPKKPITYNPSKDVKVMESPRIKEKTVDSTGGLRSRWIPSPLPKPLTHDRCIGCGVNVIPGTVRTGSVLGNLQHFSVKGIDVIPIEGEIEFLGFKHRFVYRTDEVEIVKRVAFRKREKGLLCDKCSSNCRVVVDPKSGERHMMVKTDPLPGFFDRKDTKFFEHETSIYDSEERIGRMRLVDHNPPIDVRSYNALTNPKRRFERVDGRVR